VSRDGSDELLDEDDICEGDVCRTEANKDVLRKLLHTLVIAMST
jgi:hypothetical protein